MNQTRTEQNLTEASRRALFALRTATRQLQDLGYDTHAQQQAIQDLEATLEAYIQDKPP